VLVENLLVTKKGITVCLIYPINQRQKSALKVIYLQNYLQIKIYVKKVGRKLGVFTWILCPLIHYVILISLTLFDSRNLFRPRIFSQRRYSVITETDKWNNVGVIHL
jgi:hypothetical protein